MRPGASTRCRPPISSASKVRIRSWFCQFLFLSPVESMILELRVMAPLFPGCDYEHWLIVMNKPGGEGASKHQMIDCYIQTLAKVLASEEEAKKKIYNVSCERYFGFGCEIDEETSNKLEGIPGVLFVLPDSFVEPEHKDYGGVDFKVKMVNIAGKKLKLAGWDTASKSTRPSIATVVICQAKLF
ncbi:multiple organellar RNA editing factor 2, chloroplastic-like isoform X3 [Hordeum vulgare subsp. vulgare]|uniref:multiple organellar RNA editing factor 2, chloroplastic-like isoform X3 n=1 Tax=Hordeum vulgare subsp. vulgare TaxID=112509 RepID=UPI000B469519|nr:multiple organellar RNA editing factor 2, chloroplastic-like isoform X3 [Hordeum vulgare subsp. vulgare]